MDNEMQVFSYEGNDVRTVCQGDNALWVLKDVCDVIGLTDTNKVAERLDDDELTRIKLVSGGQTREMYAVNESGLYNVILRSDKPEAKKFKRWITHEVLPSIRKHGAYMTPQTIDNLIKKPDMIIEIATALKNEHKAKQLLKEEKASLEIELNTSLEYYTVAKYNKVFKMHWQLPETQRIGRELTDYCRRKGIILRKCLTNDERFGSVNSYPITAWQGFMEEQRRLYDIYYIR